MASIQKSSVVKHKSTLKRADKSFEGLGIDNKLQRIGSSSSLSKSLNNSINSGVVESQYRCFNPNRLKLQNENDSQFSQNSTNASRQRDLLWTFENQSKRQEKIGQLESTHSTRSISLIDKVKVLEEKKINKEPKIKRSEMTEAQKQMVSQRKKNVQLMTLLRNLENQINTKFMNIIKLKKMNKEYQQLNDQTQKLYTERVLVKNDFARQCEEYIDELKDVSITAQISMIRQNTLKYEEEQRQIEKQVQIQTEDEENIKKDILQLEEKLKNVKLEVENLQNEHHIQQKKKDEMQVGYNEKVYGCLKQYRQIRILNDQIACMKKEFKTICYVANKKIKSNKVFDYEPYFKIKDKKALDLYIPDRFTIFQSQSQQNISSQLKFSQIQSQLKSSVYKSAVLPKYNLILTSEHSPLFGELNDKMSLELEIFIKSTIYKNINSILSKLSFNSQEYDYVFNWQQKNEQGQSLQLDDQQQVFNIFESYIDIIRKRDITANSANQTNVLFPPNVMLMMGDKDRGAFTCVLQNIKDLLQFNNGFLKVKEISYTFKDLDEEEIEAETMSYDDLMEKFDIELKEQLYKQNILISCCISVIQQDYTSKQSKQQTNQLQRAEGYKKYLNIIVLNNQLSNKNVLAKQIIQTMNKEKIQTQKDKIIDRIESYIKSAEKRVLITEIPNLIKYNDKSINKYNLIKDILNFGYSFENNHSK